MRVTVISVALSLPKGRKLKIMGIKLAAENNGIEMFKQTGVAAK